jgi:hypothetical protein
MQKGTVFSGAYSPITLDIIGNKTVPQKAVKSAEQITKERGTVHDILRSNER